MITEFVQAIKIAPDYVETLENAVMTEWERRQSEMHRDEENLDVRIAELKTQTEATVQKIKLLSSETAIKCMEDEIVKIEGQLNELTVRKEQKTMEKTVDIKRIMEYVKYFIEHLEYLLLQQMNPVAKAGYFGVLFDKAPTYNEIAGLGTPELAAPLELNRLFTEKKLSPGNLAGDESLNWHHLLSDFVSVGRKLEELGFVYRKGSVLTLETFPENYLG